MQLRSFPPEPVAIPVSPLDEDADEVVVAFLGIQKMAVTDTVFLDLGAISTRMSADSADVAVTVVDDIEPRLVVTALGSGGVVRRDLGLPTSAVDSLCLLCRAPEDGYRMRDTTASPADRSLYFVRLADGRRYARMSLSVQAQLQNLEREGRMTTGGPVWVNRAGGRGLCGPDPYIIDPLFFADKSIREMLRGRVERTRHEGRATPDHAKN